MTRTMTLLIVVHGLLLVLLGMGLFAVAFFCGLVLARGSWRDALR